MSIKADVEDMNAVSLEGKWQGALDEYYADDAVRRISGLVPLVGKATIHEQVEDFINGCTQFGSSEVKAVAVDEGNNVSIGATPGRSVTQGREGTGRIGRILSSSLLGSILWLSLSSGVPALGQTGPLINEFMASNTQTLANGAGQFNDWIELYNPSVHSVDVGGMYLTDNLADPTKWQFPKGQPLLTMIPARGYLLIWADGDSRAGELHASFGLSAAGEQLGLFAGVGTLVDSVVFGVQFADVSYGRWPDGNDAWQYMGTPTPGRTNKQGYAGVVADLEVSPHRGFYDTPIDVTLATDDPGAEIWYTTDADVPHTWVPNARGGGIWTGKRYASPIHVTRTTCLRTVAVKTGWKDSAVTSHTYLFLSDVIEQPARPAGFPSLWSSTPADYEMDPSITTSATYAPLMEKALLSLPTLSVVMKAADLFGSKGIYANPSNRGLDWERPASVELIYPGGQDGFQINCGIRIQGGWFRPLANTPKKSFRLVFKGAYGASKLRYPLFGDDAVAEFDTITLRAGANDGYSWDAARYTEQYTRDEFGRDLQRATGNVGSHGTFVHLYLNGLYWGLYNPVERPDASFSASYLGGDKGDWDALHNGGSLEVIQGDLNAWNQMYLSSAGGTSTRTRLSL